MSLQDNICPPLKAVVTTSTGTVGTICWGENIKSTTPSPNYNVAFNKPYYFKENNKNNCCHGQFGWKNKNGKGGLSKSPPSPNNTKVFYTKNNRGFIFGDISYPRNQQGRWNLSTTNTKLYPVISIGRANPICNPTVSNGNCIGYKGTQNEPLTVQKQSGRLFSNTNPNMSKKQIFSYLVKNRKYLNR